MDTFSQRSPSAPYNTTYLCGGCIPHTRLFVGYISVVQVQARSTSPGSGASRLLLRSIFASCAFCSARLPAIVPDTNTHFRRLSSSKMMPSGRGNVTNTSSLGWHNVFSNTKLRASRWLAGPTSMRQRSPSAPSSTGYGVYDTALKANPPYMHVGNVRLELCIVHPGLVAKRRGSPHTNFHTYPRDCQTLMYS
jgi:hypothetical protein